MGISPLPPLPQLRDPKNPLEGVKEAIGFRAMLEQQRGAQQLQGQTIEANAMKLQQAKQAEAEQAKLKALYREAGGNFDAMLKLAPQAGISPQTVQGLQENRTKNLKELAALDKDKIAQLKEKNALVGSSAQAVLSLPPEQRAAAMQQERQKLVASGLFNEQEIPQNATDDELQMLALSSVETGKQIDQIQKNKEFKQKETELSRNKWNIDKEGLALMAESGTDEEKKAAKQALETLKKFGGSSLVDLVQRSVDMNESPEVRQNAKNALAAYSLARTVNRINDEGLTPQESSRVQALASQFDTNPVVKNFNEQANRAAGVRAIVEKGFGGPGDLATVYEFMKALDPTSVVRESEYESAAKSGNIFTGAMARFNGMFKPEGGKLSEQVKKDFLGILNEKLGVSQRQVKGIYDDFGRRINKITGGGGGNEYLTDYTSMLDNAAGAQGAASAVSGLSIEAGGKKYTFKDKASLDAFKKEAGLQ